jgi:hypothetical protein
MTTISKRVRTDKTLQLRSLTEDIVFSVGSGHNVILPEFTDFSACSTALNQVVSVDLSSKQDASAKLTQLSGLSGAENQVVAFNGDGELVAINQATIPTYNTPLSVNGSNEVSFDETGFLKSTDIGSTVQGFDSSLLRSSDIGSTVQGFDSSLLRSSDIGVSVQGYDANILTTDAIGDTVQGKNEHLDEFIALHGVAWNHSIPYFNETNGAFELTDSNQIQVWGNMQEANQALSDLINSNPSNGNVLKYDGSNWVAASSSIDDSNFAKLDASGNAFQGVIQQQLSGSSSYSYTKVFDATSNNTTEFSLVNVAIDPAQAHHVKCEVVAVGHNGATTIRKLSCCVCNSNQTMTQSNEYGDDGLFPIDLGKCEFNVASNFLRVRVQGVDGLTTRYHAKLEVMSVANISQ